MSKENKELALRSEGGSIVGAKKILTAAFQELALPFSGKMKAKPSEMEESYRALIDFQSVIKDTIEVAKEKMKKLVENKGEVTTEKGSMERVIGGYLYAMRPTRTGTDPKKLEALLRAKEVEDIGEYMEPTVTYKVSEEKLRKAFAKKVLTQAELDTCEYEKSYALQPPKKVEE